jgi:hypothetical protein
MEVVVQVIEPFTKAHLKASEWLIEVPEGTDYNDQQYTPNYFRSSDLLSAVMKDFKKFVVEPVQYRTDRTQDLRRWDKIEPAFLGPLAKTMGANVRLDRMDTEARRRAVHEWIPFTQYAGTRHFIDFEGYVIDTVFTIEHLWTNDYRNFIPKDPSIQYPAYYPTNHVALRYDANTYDLSNSDDIRYIYELFYQLASVPLVLDYIYSLIQEDTGLWIVGVGHEQEHAPIESNEMPPNFWIVGVAADVDYLPIEGNVLPPNFWIMAADADIQWVSDHVTYGTIPEFNYELYHAKSYAHLNVFSTVETAPAAIRQGVVSIQSSSLLEFPFEIPFAFWTRNWADQGLVAASFVGSYTMPDPEPVSRPQVAQIENGRLRLNAAGYDRVMVAIPIMSLDVTKSYSVSVEECQVVLGTQVVVSISTSETGYGTPPISAGGTPSTIGETVSFTFTPVSSLMYLTFAKADGIGFFGNVRVTENP